MILKDQTNEERLQKLYKRIPEFECEPGCNECCGPILMCKTEWAKFKEHKQIEKDSLDCPYLADGKCSEYENRPFVCRIFGAMDGAIPERRLECPKGCKPKNPIRTVASLRICAQYDAICDSEGGPVGPAMSLLRR